MEMDADYKKAVEVLNSLSDNSTEDTELDVDKIMSEQQIELEYDYDKAVGYFVDMSSPARGPAQQSQLQALSRMQSAKEFSEDIGKAEHELSTMLEKLSKSTGRISSAVEDIVLKNAPGSVLVSLSVQDQIAELERISLGLEEGVFDKQRTGIIINEVRHLSRSVKKTKPGDANDDLVGLRNRRLDEVMRKLHMA